VAASRTLLCRSLYNGDGMRTSKAVAGDITEYVLDLAATLPVVVSDTEAVYLYGLDIIAQEQAETLYYVHDGLRSLLLARSVRFGAWGGLRPSRRAHPSPRAKG
jgi:hypothetical protein